MIVSLLGKPFPGSVSAFPPQSVLDCISTVPNEVPIANVWSYPQGLSIGDIPYHQGLVLDSNVNKGIPHNGEDYGNHSAGDRISAVSNGIVACVFEGTDKGNLGHAIFVLSKLPDGRHITTLYGHLSSKDLIGKGAPVVRGETLIGKLGDSIENGGWAPHLHIGIRDGYFIGREEGWLSSCWGYLFKRSLPDRPNCPENPNRPLA